MRTDPQWVAVEKVVREALFDDVDVLNYPPVKADDWDALIETLSDHICAAFRTESRTS